MNARLFNAVLISASLWACLAGSTEAAELYRYYNNRGEMIMGTFVPPQFARNGYTVLDESGRVLRVVERQLTADEIKEKEALLAAKAEAEAAAAEQKAIDDELLRMYSRPEDVVEVRDRKLASIDGAIKTTRGNMQRLKTQKINLQIQAAEKERAGLAIPPKVLEDISALDVRIDEREDEIRMRMDEQREVRAFYAQQLRRLRELLNLPPTDLAESGE